MMGSCELCQSVVTMTPDEYFLRWTVRAVIAFPFVLMAFFYATRYAVRWGVQHGMDRFVQEEKKQ